MQLHVIHPHTHDIEYFSHVIVYVLNMIEDICWKTILNMTWEELVDMVMKTVRFIP